MTLKTFASGDALTAITASDKVTYSQIYMMGTGDRVSQRIQVRTVGIQIKLFLYGDAAYGQGNATGFVAQHDHSTHTHTYNSRGDTGGSFEQTTSGTQVGTASAVTPLANTVVPQAVQIWIDGTQYTATIGDPNVKGATMFDAVNNDWGVDGTTVWNTGELNLTSLITWSVGEHTIEFRQNAAGNSGGRLSWIIYVE